jgi:hypothetical protein
VRVAAELVGADAFQVRLPVKSIPVFLLTPGPRRWRLWKDDWSESTNLRVPGLAWFTVVPLARLSVIVEGAATVP